MLGFEWLGFPTARVITKAQTSNLNMMLVEERLEARVRLSLIRRLERFMKAKSAGYASGKS